MNWWTNLLSIEKKNREGKREIVLNILGDLQRHQKAFYFGTTFHLCVGIETMRC